jgi:hypothetical protein
MRQQYFIGGILFLLTSCAASPIHLADTKALAPQEIVVFGRVQVLSHGKPVVWSSSPIFEGAGKFFLLLFPEATPSAAVDYTLMGDGAFYWHLKPGRYTLAGLEWTRGNSRTAGRILAKFTVAETPPLVYVGTLTVSFAGGNYTWRIEDEYTQALQTLQTKFPELRGEVARTLLQLEKPL